MISLMTHVRSPQLRKIALLQHFSCRLKTGRKENVTKILIVYVNAITFYPITYIASNFIDKRPDSTETLRKSTDCTFVGASSANEASLIAFALALITR